MEVQETTQSEIESISNSPLEVQDLNMKADSSLYEQKQFVSSQQKNNADVENNVEYPDFSSTFTTDRVFETRSDFIQWAQKVGLTCGTVVVVSKSENATSDGTRRLYLACERSGIYRDHRKKKEIDNKEKVDKQEGKMKKPRRTGTKKTNCPFRLKGVFVRGSEDKWKVEVQCARHNHSLAISFEGHSFVGRLRPEQEKFVFDLMKTGVGPKHALNVIKDRDPNNSSTIRHIYNAKQKQRKLEKGDRTELQQLLHLLHNNGYVEVSRCEEGSVIIRNLFWAHPESIKLAKCFPKVFIMDPTYKTNKYRWPLLEIVGVTSTMKTFSICFALMEHETEDDFTWALRCLQVLLGDNISPDVIVTDRDYALMNAAAVIFPTAAKFLCRWHISKDILAKGKREIRDWHSSTDVQATEEKETQEKDMAETLCDKWVKVVLATTEAEYIHQLKELEKEFQR